MAGAVAAFCLGALGVVAVTGCTKGGSSNTISGRIEVLMDQEVVPLANAYVTIRPFEPDVEGKRPDPAPELTTVLTGVATTNAAGSFLLTALGSSETFAEYPLLRSWKYEIRIEAPGYYIHRGVFPYEKGASFVQIRLEEKDVDDVLDESGMIQIPEGGIQIGAAPKRGV